MSADGDVAPAPLAVYMPRMKPDPVDFYFDFISPYAYFAWTRLGPLCAKHQVRLVLHPVLFAGILKHHGQLGPAEIPAKRRYTFEDIHRSPA